MHEIRADAVRVMVLNECRRAASWGSRVQNEGVTHFVTSTNASYFNGRLPIDTGVVYLTNNAR